MLFLHSHWINTLSSQMKHLLLTILDVSCGTGIDDCVGSALFSYLTDQVVGEAFLLYGTSSLEMMLLKVPQTNIFRNLLCILYSATLRLSSWN
jgi:hypothetical protein